MAYWVFNEAQLQDALHAFITRRNPSQVRDNHAYDQAAVEGNLIREFLFHSPEVRLHKLLVEEKTIVLDGARRAGPFGPG